MAELETTDELQFDRAEPAGPGGDGPVRCAGCAAEIDDVYYEVAGNVTCDGCHATAAASRTGGSGAARLLRATFLGVVAAVLGGILYWGFTALTGWELGLVAIVVGLLVGGAVKVGAQARGGWLYQLLAMGLTYLSIVGAYVPFVHEGFAMAEAEAVSVAPTEDAATPVALFAESDAPPVAAEAPAAAVDPVAVDDPAVEVTAIPRVFYWILVVALAFAAPFLQGFENLIGILIIGFALYEAWVINRRTAFAASGPFRLGERRPAAAVAGG